MIINLKPVQIILFIIFVFISSLVFTQNANYSIGLYDSLYSKILDEERRLVILMPHGATTNDTRYPVLYLFDAEGQFTKSIGIIDHLSNTIGIEKCPQMIVVGIFHLDRLKDLIPPASTKDSTNKNNFNEFVEKELVPFIDKKYPTQPFRVLVGHSLGGLRVINTMIYKPNLFNSYIALDPSLGHVKGWIENGIETFNKTDYSNKSLYIAMGQTMPTGMDTSTIAADTSGNSRHMRCIMRFAKNAITKGKKDFDFNWKYYPNESHAGVVFKGLYDGLISNFKWFVNDKLYDIFKPEISVNASIKIITDYYAKLSDKLGYKNIPSEIWIRTLIDYLTYKGWNDKAYAFAQLNTQNYPSSIRAKAQLETTKWNTKKGISNLYNSMKIKTFYSFCKKEAAIQDAEYNISEDAINILGYDLMQQKKLNDAEIIFKLNTELYPKSANVFDSYSECLVLEKKVKEGILAYRKSLELNPNNKNASRVIQQLNTKNKSYD